MKTGWIFTFLAFTFAFCLHFAALYLVDLSSHETVENEVDTGPRAFMVNPAQATYAWEQELDYFFRLKRPDFWAIPNYSVGVSSNAMDSPRHHYSPSPSYSVTMNPSSIPESAGIEMAEQVLDFRNLMEQVNLMPAIEFGKDEKKGIPELPTKIIWRLDSGEVLDSFPTTIPANIHEKVKEKPPNWYTEAEIIKESGKSVRVRLRDSSGNRVLDQFALKLIGRKIALAETEAKKHLSDTEKKLWPQNSGSVIVEVEWRPATSKINMDKDEQTRDSSDK